MSRSLRLPRQSCRSWWPPNNRNSKRPSGQLDTLSTNGWPMDKRQPRKPSESPVLVMFGPFWVVASIIQKFELMGIIVKFWMLHDWLGALPSLESSLSANQVRHAMGTSPHAAIGG